MQTRDFRRLAWLGLFAALLAIVSHAWRWRQIVTAQSNAATNQEKQNQRELLYRRNNTGVALMEQFKHELAVKEFRAALAEDANFALARINLALALFYLGDTTNAAKEAREAVKLAPQQPHAHYALALALRNENQTDAALAEFTLVQTADPQDAATNIQIGQLYAQQRRYEPAIKAFRVALEAEPYHQTAAYSLAQALLRSGNAAEGQRTLALYQKLKDSGYASQLGNVYGEKGKYGEGLLSAGNEAELVSALASTLRFTEAANMFSASIKTTVAPLSNVLNSKISKADFTPQRKRALVAPFSINTDLGDYDGDGKLDALVCGWEGDKPFVRLLHNQAGKLVDVTANSKLTTAQPVSGAVMADFDQDAKADIVLFGAQTLALWRNNGDGTFADISAKAGLPTSYADWALAAAGVDADHDGDLDLYVGNFVDLNAWPDASKETLTFPDDFPGAENKLFRNNGNGTFTETAVAMGLGGGKLKTTAIIPSDFNNTRDIDFVTVNYGAPLQLFSNQRDGTFKEIAANVGFADASHPMKAFGLGAADFNHDNFPDFALPLRSNVFTLFRSNGRGALQATTLRRTVGGLDELTSNWFAQAVDFDNDGLTDLAVRNQASLTFYRNLGQHFGLINAAEHSISKLADTRSFATGDLNQDGTAEVIAFNDQGVLTAWQSGEQKNHFTRLQLAGKTSNRSAIGAKIELRSGSLRQKREVYAASPAPARADLTFGLGFRTQVDALQLLWPAGIVQAELAIKTDAHNAFDELDRKGTSCPLLYAWNGHEYQFITDFLGGSAIGYRVGAGRNDWNYPDTDEYVLIKGAQLQPRDGLLSVRLNNQLEEVIYFDQVKLLAVDHPADVDMYPNERLLPAPPYPAFKLYTTRHAQPPVRATDEAGRDVLPLVTQIDRRYPDQFALLPFKGYAAEHTLTLDLGNAAQAAQSKHGRVLLLLHAWIDYADSTSNFAAAQAGLKLIPPYLQTKNARGEWQTALPQMGFPAGLPKTMTVKLPVDALRYASEVRIVTNMRIYWDQILVDVGAAADSPTRVTTLLPAQAQLRWRGFPREYAPDGKLPRLYDYRIIEPSAPWQAHLGNYTRYGDVRPLVLGIDDRYVITRSGDELEVNFAVRDLPALPKGWTRDYLLFADGFGKDMDIHSARPDTVGELPSHAMKTYPYAARAAYPQTTAQRAWLRTWNTRTITDQRAAHWRGKH